MINYFHAYIINPSKPSETVNLPAAQAFVDFITSPALQAQLKSYLASTSDPGGPPFVADASPMITPQVPYVYHAGKPLTVTGTVTNAQPGYPAPGVSRSSSTRSWASLALPVAHGTTNSTGAYSIRFTPPATGSYEVTTPLITQIEIPTLNPAFGDILSPARQRQFAFTVHSAITNLRARSAGGRALVVGSVAPGTGHVKASVRSSPAAGSKGASRQWPPTGWPPTTATSPSPSRSRRSRWQFKVKFQDPKQVVASTSRTVTTTVGAEPASSVTVRSVKVTKAAR